MLTEYSSANYGAMIITQELIRSGNGENNRAFYHDVSDVCYVQ